MKRVILLAGVLVCADARAQNASDLPTTETQSSTQAGLPTTQTQPEPPATGGGPRAYYPGMPLPQPAPAEGSAAKGGKEPPRQGVILGDTDYSSDYENGGVSVAPGGPPADVPDTHVVQKGDTLWDLSARYYRNAWGWPKLWSYNPQITNPHWIYPGDVIRLLPPGGGPAPPPAPTAAKESLPTSRIIGRAKGPTGVFLRQTGFVEPGELAQAGKIIGSKEEKLMLGTLDEAYVQYKKERPFQVGERYTIYRPTQAVKHPLTGKYLGHMVEIFGEGEVRAVTDGKIARIAIVDSVNPIERGFLVGPLKREFKVVQPVADKQDMQGVVVATLVPHELVGADDLVFIDRGKDDGVELGNRFVVTRRGDGYQPLLSKGPMDDRRFPRENIGELLVVDLRDHLATGIVTTSTKEAAIGDRVEARAGY